MPRISLILGTRPEAIKLIPVCLALRKAGLETRLISTGQHQEMLKPIFDFFKVQPNQDLNLMTHNQSLSTFSSLAYTELDKLIAKDQADLYLVQGDTTTAMIASTVAFYHQRGVGHVEAGLRTGNMYSPYPEEFNRRVISLTAKYHFAPTETAYKNLEDENVSGGKWITGNTVIDSLMMASRMVDQDLDFFKRKFEFLGNTGNILITCHRRESFGKDLEDICKALLELTRMYDNFNFIFPVHLNPNVRTVVSHHLEQVSNLWLVDPVSYPEMVYLIGISDLILTDSGGIQEEAPTLNVPIVVMRNHTERPEGIEAGCAVLSGVASSDIVKSASTILDNEQVYNRMANAENPYGDGTSSDQIASIIKQYH